MPNMTPGKVPGNPVTPGSPPRLPSGMEKWLPKYAQDQDREYVGEPWSQQPREGAKAYTAFCIYRDMEPDERTIAKVTDIYNARNGLSPKSQGCYRWSVAHRWVERAEAYDAYIAAKTRAKLERKRLRAAERQAEDAEAAQSIAMLPINELRKRMAEQGGELEAVRDLDDVSLLKLYKVMVGDLPAMQRAEREALGSGGGGPVVDHEKVRERGKVLRAILENKTTLQMVERAALELDEASDETA